MLSGPMSFIAFIMIATTAFAAATLIGFFFVS
jgi:hypothetical protein